MADITTMKSVGTAGTRYSGDYSLCGAAPDIAMIWPLFHTWYQVRNSDDVEKVAEPLLCKHMHTAVAASTTCSPPPCRHVRMESCAKHFLMSCTETVGMLAQRKENHPILLHLCLEALQGA